MGYRRVVVGTDGSATAGVAVESAAAVAAASDGELLVVTAYQPQAPRDHGTEEMPDEIRWMITDSGQAHEHAVKAAEVALKKGVPSKKIHSISEKGDPATALVKVAEERGGDLIVVGSKGMNSASRFLLGNVPNKVSHHAPCDVMIVHTVS